MKLALQIIMWVAIVAFASAFGAFWGIFVTTGF